MLNSCEFIGHLGKDPEIRAMQNGDEVANLSLGVTERWKDKSGQQQERTEWVRIVAFGGVVNVIKNYTKKGSKIFVQGKLQTRKWTDKNGNDQYTTEVVLQGFGGKLVLLDSKQDGGGGGYQQPAQQQVPSQDLGLDDEIPF